MTTITTTTTTQLTHKRVHLVQNNLQTAAQHPLTPTTAAVALSSSCPTASASGRLRICVDDHWYDLTHWQHTHPGGAEILHHMNNKDATDVFYSLHSDAAIDRLTRMHNTSLCLPVKTGELPPPTPATVSFRALRQQLRGEGWFNRSLLWECFYHGSVYLMATLGSYCAYSGHPFLAVLFLGVCMQQAGWIGHDCVHGRGSGQFYLGRVMSGLINAFSPTWWSHKHNTHHVYTNHIGIDVDIENDPVFHLFIPHREHDVWFRAYQHWYFIPVAAFLYISWRIQSIQHVIKQNNVREMIPILINLVWLLWLGLPIALSSIYLAGGLVAVIVTATHQSEEMLDGRAMDSYSFLERQFATTRDASCADPFMEWLWGGMQYQLEHHLFPTMPKYKYAALSHRVKEWARQNGLEYRVDGVMQIWKRNFATLAYFAKQASTSPDGTQQQQPQHSPFQHLLGGAM